MYKYLGYCHLVALALHRYKALPLCAFYGYRKETNQRVLVHVGVVYNGSFMDELGSWDCDVKEAGLILRQKNPPYDFFRIHVFESETPKWKALLRRTNAHRFSPLKYWEISKFVKSNFLRILDRNKLIPG